MLFQSILAAEEARDATVAEHNALLDLVIEWREGEAAADSHRLMDMIRARDANIALIDFIDAHPRYEAYLSDHRLAPYDGSAELRDIIKEAKKSNGTPDAV